MGYTHYWTIHTKILPAKQFKNFSINVKKALKNLPKNSYSSGAYYAEEPLTIHGGDGIYGGDGKGKPIINKQEIIFNGDGDKKKDLSDETFFLSRKQEPFSFCKTNRKPYDFFVQICLILAKKHFKNEISINSDGDETDWKSAFTFVKKHFDIDMRYDFLTSDKRK